MTTSRTMILAAALAGLAQAVAACSSSSSAGGSGGDAANQACDASFEAVYRDIYTCVGVELPGDHVATLKTQYRKYCVAQLGEPGRTASAAQLEACAKAHQAQTCGTQTTPAECKLDSFAGTLAEGAGCYEDAQCQSLFCAIDVNSDVSCGKCAKRVADGEACSHATDVCVIGDRCDATSGKCVKATEVTPVAAGGGCIVSLQCEAALGCINNKCAPRVGEGGACPNGDECEQALGCDATASKCTKRSLAKAGEACDGEVVLCETGNCNTPNPATKGTCPTVIADGAACTATDGSQTCLELSTCIAGKCTPLDPTVCK